VRPAHLAKHRPEGLWRGLAAGCRGVAGDAWARKCSTAEASSGDGQGRAALCAANPLPHLPSHVCFTPDSLAHLPRRMQGISRRSPRTPSSPTNLTHSAKPVPALTLDPTHPSPEDAEGHPNRHLVHHRAPEEHAHHRPPPGTGARKEAGCKRRVHEAPPCLYLRHSACILQLVTRAPYKLPSTLTTAMALTKRHTRMHGLRLPVPTPDPARAHLLTRIRMSGK
jgi:hypothetical protein